MRQMSLLDLLFLSSAICIAGCGQNDGRQAVSGTVNVDGNPLGEGAINFRPAAGTQGPSSGGPIDQGRFTVPAKAGLLPGTYEVTIIAMRETGRIINDPQKGPVPELVQVRFRRPPPNVTVSADEKNAFEFELHTP